MNNGILMLCTIFSAMLSVLSTATSWAAEVDGSEFQEFDPYLIVAPGFQRLDHDFIMPRVPVNQCDVVNYYQDYTWQEDSSNTGHLTGKHGIQVKFRNRCSCSLGCRNDCSPQPGEKEFIEEGSLDFGMKPEGYMHVTGTLVSNTNAKSALFEEVKCSQSVAGDITSTVSGEGVISSHTLTQTFTCRKCDEAPSSPIVLNVNGKPFAFSDDYDTVAFDIDNDGIKEDLAWTLENSLTAFLALDRNGNGQVDNGGELFGNHTEQPGSARKNGYLALRLFDDDSDGIISASDAIFYQLLLWTDRNHNGLSEGSELSPAYLHLRSIGLDYVRSDRQDRAGNVLSLFGVAETKNHKKIYTVDVNFLEVVEMEN